MVQITRDVVIVGAGLSGAVCAAYLAKAGVDVLLIDKADLPGASPKVEVLRENAAAHMNALGAFDELDKMSACHRSIQLINSKGEGALLPREYYSVSGYKLNTLLLEIAESYGAEIRRGCHVRDLYIENGEIHGVKVSRGTQDSVIRSEVLIAADGVTSFVGRKAGLIEAEETGGWTGEWGFFQGVNLDDTLAKSQYDGYGIYAFSKLINPGYLWIMPCGHSSVREGYCNIGYIAPRKAGETVSLKSVIESNPGALALTQGAQLVGEIEAGELLDAAIIRQRCADRVILIGAAAAVDAPLFKDSTLADLDSAKAAAEAAMDALGNENFTKEFIEEAYEKRISKESDEAAKYSRLTQESMYDIDVIDGMISRMGKDPTYNKKCESILKEAYL